MRIVLCHKDTTWNGPAGGFSTAYCHLAREYVRLGHEVMILTAREGRAPFGIQTIVVPKNQAPGARELGIVSALAQANPDVVECPSWGSELTHWLEHVHTCPVVVRIDIPCARFPETRSTDQEDRLVRSADALIGISRWCISEWQARVGRGAPLIPYGVEPVRCSLSKRPGTVLWVGKATWMKGIDILADVAKELTISWHVVAVVGDSRGRRDDYVATLEQSGVVVRRSLAEDTYQRLLCESAVFLSTARIEGFCLAALEAMSAGAVPVVPKGIGGTLDFVSQNNGILYSSPEALVDTLACSRNQFAVLSAEARSTAESYTWRRCARESLAVYEDSIRSWT